MEERKPDLIGTWFQNDQFGEFKMFIDKKKRKNNKFLILGEITDKFGIATFQGTLSRKFIKFVKLYDLTAMKNLTNNYLFYKGKWDSEYLSRNKNYNFSRRDISKPGMFTGVYLKSNKDDKKSKKHIDILINLYKNQMFEIFIENENLKKDLIDLKKY